MPQVGFHRASDNHRTVYVQDGRHRFAWMRDHGAEALPVAVLADEARDVAKLVGTKNRICRVNMFYIPEQTLARALLAATTDSRPNFKTIPKIAFAPAHHSPASRPTFLATASQAAQ